MIDKKFYDEHLSPLVHQVYDICAQHKVPMLASFIIGRPGEEDESVEQVTTALLTDEFMEPLPPYVRRNYRAAGAVIIHGVASFIIAMLMKPEHDVWKDVRKVLAVADQKTPTIN